MYIQWHGDVVSKQPTGAQSLRHGDGITIDCTTELGDGIQADVTFQGRSYPGANTHVAGYIYPLTASHHATMKGRFENNVPWSDDVQHLPLLVRVVDADEFLVKGDGQW